ncbi:MULTISPECIES: hypothetical protein [Arthrobacter]|uniref:Uncharacterized protein n=1 Tax=Arthrobacter terricola TaxID=2547396 RepID=A0A4R5KKC0_9MICC|nr:MULTISPECIES: hypothetical protein [Arthrobacter]MBT8161618.1 hypothetical protein [Arthrobacter sp. GN70]TDF95285.1 hypothetical protein E1809_12265 [Arthrobacter terricola]
MTSRFKATGRKRVALALGAATLACGLGITAAAYTDFAVVNLGTGAANSGIGNPNKFDIAVKDAGGVLRDADSKATAVVLPLTSGTEFSETKAVQFDTTVVNRQPGIIGDLTVSLYDPDPQANDLFGGLLFTVYLDGSATPAIANATATQVNQAALRFTDVAPGQEHSVKLSVLLAKNSASTATGKSTQLGVLTNGESK